MSALPNRPEPRLTRREVLTAAVAAFALPALFPEGAEAQSANLALPGPFRGRVIEVFHPGSVVEGKVRQEAVSEMVTRGMLALTGAKDETSAWKHFFGPGDVVGIKGSGVGRPHSVSQPETLLAVMRGLMLAGVRPQDILLFERYGEELRGSPYANIAPKGVQTASAVRNYDDVQTDLEGYDPTTFVEMPRVHSRADPQVAVNRRSHLCKIVSQQVTKVISVSTLKDHASAGITMALKNMSHGLVNNVSRSHLDAESNWCDTFIPTVVGMTKIREKVALHIGDGLIGTYDGGPGGWNPHFRTWEYRSLFFATDPVAMDRIGWTILDAKRASAELPPLAETGLKAKNPGFETFDKRQPEHVLLAAQAGLGEADLKKIQHQKLRLGG